MTKQLEDLFDLAGDEEETPEVETEEDHQQSIVSLEEALSNSEKINQALSEVKGMEVHDTEMDDIALKAIDSYQTLMDLGMNISDMAAGQVFTNAAAMLKIALDARDQKVNRKLKQIDLMIKKANLDHRVNKDSGKEDDEDSDTPQAFNREQLIKMMKDTGEN